MYNRYIKSGTSYTRIPQEDGAPFRPPQSEREETAPAGPLEGITGLLGGLFKGLNLEGIDTGDILLVLIMVFLYLEGDNLELVITLGLLLLFRLGDKKAEGEEGD